MSVKETDDGKEVDVSDAGSIPATSTNLGLTGQNNHGLVERKPKWFYFTEDEWNRSVGWGKVPPERTYGGDLVSTRRIETLQEDSDT